MRDLDFPGFEPPAAGRTLLDQFAGHLARIRSRAEIVVILYLFGHAADLNAGAGLSVDDFLHGRRASDGSRLDPGTGLTYNSIHSALGLALNHGFVTVDVDPYAERMTTRVFRLRRR